MLRRALSLLILSVFAAQAAAALESIQIRSRLDPNAIEITGIDVLFLYDEATAARIPATKSAWYGNRRALTRELGDEFDLVSTFIPQGFDSAGVTLPERAAAAVRVLVFAEHEAADNPPVNITELTNVLIEIDPFGIRVSASPPQTNPTAELLRELIRIDTSNPPGNEGALAEFLRPRFEALGFEVSIIETPAAGKAHFIARLRGDGSKRPLLLAAHADVVGVEPDLWTQEPFAGDIVDGYVYGRGAIDYKGGMAVFAEAVMRLARNDVPLARDVIFLAEADEEGGSYGTGWLARDHWHLIDAEFALNEGGWIIKRQGSDDVRYVSISTADKFSISLRVTASGHSIHSSMPRPDNAIFALARALDKLSEYDGGVQFIPITRQFFETLAQTAEEPEKTWLEDFIAGTDAARFAQADRRIGVDPLMRAFTRNTIAPVILESGFRLNVIPGTATALVNFRLIPGTDVAAFMEEIRRVMADPAISVEIITDDSQEVALARLQERSRQSPSPEDTELYQALAASAREQYPEALVTSYLFQAGTDAGAWRNRGVPVYGIYPYPIDQDDLSRMHGNDERVPVQSLAEGTEMIFRVLLDVAGRGP